MPLPSDRRRVANTLQASVPGTLGGRLAAPMPAGTPPMRGEAWSQPGSGGFTFTFHLQGVLADADSLTSDPHPVPVPGACPMLMATLAVADSTSDITVDFYKNATLVDTITIPQGDTIATLTFSSPVTFDGLTEVPHLVITDAGTDAEGLAVSGLVS